ncbi:hypothetical protein [Salinarimonas chemoclinalis]|uniref:hypothetical protein n=1 Tax=Salinarimonas chemoclinalis TaxID=3241599 RepID=UPI003556306E
MKYILMTTAAALLFAAPAAAQQVNPGAGAAPAVPQTPLEVEERRQLRVNPDDQPAPQGLTFGTQSGSYYVDCTDPGVVCENYENLSTGSVGGPAVDGVTTGVGAPDTAIETQERRRLLTDEDDVGPGSATAPQ